MTADSTDSTLSTEPYAAFQRSVTSLQKLRKEKLKLSEVRYQESKSQ